MDLGLCCYSLYLTLPNTYTPSLLQDVVAPVDHHVGAHIKSVISKFFHEEMELHQKEWEDQNLPAGQRRMLMAAWTVIAWEHTKHQTNLLRQSFVSTGFLLAKDGSEDHLIKMSGLPEHHVYSYREPVVQDVLFPSIPRVQ